MKSFLAAAKLTSLFFLITAFSLSCNSTEPMDRFNDIRYEVTTHTNQPLIFPDDLKGKYTVFGFFYTHCPDICPLMVANMKRVYQELGEDRDRFQFMFMTFDPRRDSVQVLNSYYQAFRLDPKDWTFLHANVDQVHELTKRMGVKVLFQPETLDEEGNPYYLIDHTDKVSILNEKAELVDHYNASRITPEILARELKKMLE